MISESAERRVDTADSGSDRAADGDIPLRDYALIGDCHGSALVSREGSIDWCCLRRFDADPIFCRILDAERGGFLLVQPADPFDVERAYLPGTNILRTTYTTAAGRLELTDFMPVGRKPKSGVHDYVSLDAPHWVVRILDCVEGRVPLRVRYRPTVEFGRRPATLMDSPGGVVVENGPALSTDLNFSLEGEIAEAEPVFQQGDRTVLTVTAGHQERPPSPERIASLLDVTRAFWEEWSDYCRYGGPYRETVLRSALALKLLTYAPSGALVAAPTTSLPEKIGGERNWDYRYCWLRDATFTLYSLSALGYSGEARRFAAFLQRSCKGTHPRVQIMYGIAGESELTEATLDHLDGYQGSRPVRVGNAAHNQQQLDVYGEVLDWAYLAESLGSRFDRKTRHFLRQMADFIAEHWQEPGEGIWEMRGPPRHHVFGKMMCWVTADRVLRMFGHDERLERLKTEIEQSIRRRGIDSESGSLRQAFDEEGVDAALLLAPLVGFPLNEQSLTATIDAVERELGHGNYLRRYVSEDGLSGSEGAFLICSFWLVDAKLMIGRVDEARALYERLLKCANDVGLYSEEIDPETHEFLGNFPQAFTHLALIQCAVHFELLEQHGLEALRGTHADRARLNVEATSGLRALWASFKKTGRVGRIRSSKASMLRLGEL